MRIILLGLCLFLGACAGGGKKGLLTNDIAALTDHKSFKICAEYGCKKHIETGLDAVEWQEIENFFVPRPKTALQERARIQQAIQSFEIVVGEKTGTDIDRARAMIIPFNTKGQLDCIDEAFNTSIYLHLLKKAGLIRFHYIGRTVKRGNYVTRWPHNSATIHVTGFPLVEQGAHHYVVDSWFHKNGVRPEIIPVSTWVKGWSPS